MQDGFIQIYTGEGKGKTTAALGLAFRAAGRKKKVLFVQFLKGIHTGEEISMNENEYIEHLKLSETVRFFNKLAPEEQAELKARTEKEWGSLIERIETSPLDVLVLDEIMIAISHGLIEESDVIKLLNNKPQKLEVILTGRYTSDHLIENADLVTEMKKLKHYYDKGVTSRLGIEY
ncbi:MAG: cob(I)yrinic acid a,c-diamide adenosyltransferase [Clostridium sp.]|nr:cob(I)yrinic acid a,c-diamide adenosyltransferase [Clostridium sp.]